MHKLRRTVFLAHSFFLLKVANIIFFTPWVPSSRYIHLSRSALFFFFICIHMFVTKHPKNTFGALFHDFFLTLIYNAHKKSEKCSKSIFWMFGSNPFPQALLDFQGRGCYQTSKKYFRSTFSIFYALSSPPKAKKL